MRRGPTLAPSVLLVIALACSSSPERDATQHTRLPEGVVARVGETDIAAATIERIAKAQGVAPGVAVQRAISDAVLARAASPEKVGRDAAAVATRAAHARALIEVLQAAAAAQGPPTDAEIDKLTAERWTEFDRPAAVRTSHAVALVKSPGDDAAARSLAEEVARTLAGVRDPAIFQDKARAIAGRSIELRVERLPPVLVDGRVYVPDKARQDDERFDEDFTRAAHALEQPGDQSAPVKTRFGYHVILLEERLPESRPSLEERRRLLERDVYARRAQAELQALVATLRASAAPEISRAADELTAGISFTP